MTATSSLIATTDAAALLRRAIQDSDWAAADRMLVDAVTRLSHAEGSVPEDVLTQPDSTGDSRYDTLLATSYAFALLRRH